MTMKTFIRATGIGIAAATLIALAAPITFAFAQAAATPAPEAPGTVGLGGLLTTVIPYLADFVLVGLFALASLVAKWVKAKWNIDSEAKLKAIEAAHRAALHTAITTAIGNIWANSKLEKYTIDVGSETLASVLRYLRDSVPEALDYLKPSNAVIAEIATSKAVKLTAGLEAAQPTPTAEGPSLT